MRTSFNVPEGLIEEFDRTWRDEGIENRSRAVREAM
ncbi:CopG family ribbon-helix-helix protein, partial [Halorubrum sp. SP9]